MLAAAAQSQFSLQTATTVTSATAASCSSAPIPTPAGPRAATHHAAAGPTAAATMAPALPPIYEHPNPRATLLPHLQPLLPHPLPLVRRLQFHFQSPYARVYATFPPDAAAGPYSSGSGSSGGGGTGSGGSARPAPPFAALYVDRSRAPETEAWAFSTAELPAGFVSPHHHHSHHHHHHRHGKGGGGAGLGGGLGAAGRPQDLHTRETERLQVFALLRAVALSPLPPGFPQGRDPGRLLLGSLHALLLAFLQSDGPDEDVVDEAAGGLGLGGGFDSDAGELSDDETATLGPDAFYPSARSRRAPPPAAATTLSTASTVAGGDALDAASPTSAAAAAAAKDDPDAAGERTWPGRGVVDRFTAPHAKYLIPARAAAAERVGSRRRKLLAIPGLAWDVVRPDELPIALARSEVPRSERTLALLPNIAARRRIPATGGTPSGGRAPGRRRGTGDSQASAGEDELLAWAFIGVDGSLTSLQVEPRWRDRGLGKEVARRAAGLVARAEGRAGFGPCGPDGAMQGPPREGPDGSEVWLHSDVGRDRPASAAVTRALGGVEGWDVYWATVDLDRVERWAQLLDAGAGGGVLRGKVCRIWRKLRRSGRA